VLLGQYQFRSSQTDPTYVDKSQTLPPLNTRYPWLNTLTTLSNHSYDWSYQHLR